VKLFDTLRGRTKPVEANLDSLFSLPSAAVTLQASMGLVSNGKAGVCFKPPTGQPFADAQAQIEQMLRMPDDDASGGDDHATSQPEVSARVSDTADSFGYRWIIIEGSGIDDLVTRAHVVHSTLQEAGWGPQLLCSVFGFAKCPPGNAADATTDAIVAGPASVYLVYLAKRGSFYPFAPTGKEKRDTELEMSTRATLGSDLPVEADLSRWFPLWDLPL
jgi:hypothetical protein